jgi:hypothetical protein
VPSLDGHCPPGVSLSPIALHHPNLPRETDRSPLHTSRLVWLLLPGAVTRHRHLPPRSASTAGPSPTGVGPESRCLATADCHLAGPCLRPKPPTQSRSACCRLPRGPLPDLPGSHPTSPFALPGHFARLAWPPVPRPGCRSTRSPEPRPRPSQHLAHVMRGFACGSRSAAHPTHTVVRTIGRRSDSMLTAATPKRDRSPFRADSPVL